MSRAMDGKSVWQRAREKAATLERGRKRQAEARAERQRGRERAEAQYRDPHSPLSVLPPLDGSNPERHPTRRLGEDHVGPEPGPFWQPGKKPPDGGAPW